MPRPAIERKRLSRYESASKETHSKKADGLRLQASRDQQIILSLKHLKQADTSKESIRYSRYDNTSVARESGKANTASRSSQNEDSCAKSAQRYHQFNNMNLPQVVVASPEGKPDADVYHNYSRPNINPSALSALKRHQN